MMQVTYGKGLLTDAVWDVIVDTLARWKGKQLSNYENG